MKNDRSVAAPLLLKLGRSRCNSPDDGVSTSMLSLTGASKRLTTSRESQLRITQCSYYFSESISPDSVTSTATFHNFVVHLNGHLVSF